MERGSVFRFDSNPWKRWWDSLFSKNYICPRWFRKYLLNQSKSTITIYQEPNGKFNQYFTKLQHLISNLLSAFSTWLLIDCDSWLRLIQDVFSLPFWSYCLGQPDNARPCKMYKLFGSNLCTNSQTITKSCSWYHCLSNFYWLMKVGVVCKNKFSYFFHRIFEVASLYYKRICSEKRIRKLRRFFALYFVELQDESRVRWAVGW